MSQQKKWDPTSLQTQLIRALVQLQKIPGMKDALQPSIEALQSTHIHVPEDDYKNISKFKELIFKYYGNNLQRTDEHQNHTKALSDLALLYPGEKSRNKKTQR